MAATASSFADDDADFLTEVPAYLKKLARMVVRGFYTTSQILVIDALVRDLCVKEEELAELLYMDKKMLRQALMILCRDRLIKSISRMEKVEGSDQPKKFDYYFINFKSFVNVLKYKLDHMRKKIEADEKIAKNRQFYKCPRCGKEYGDLDIKVLFDPCDGMLRCSYCRGEVEEDHSLADATQSTISVAELNRLTQPLLDLIRKCENVKLAPAVLEPEPKAILRLAQRRETDKEKGNPWKVGTSARLYDDSAGIQITLNEGDDKEKQVAAKVQPSWLAKSTVHVDDDSNPSPSGVASPSDGASQKAQGTASSSKKGSNQILSDLLIHETHTSGGGGMPTVKAVKRPAAQRDEDDSSSDDEEAAKRQARALGNRSHLLEPSAGVSSSLASSDRSSPVNDIEVMDDGDDDETEDEPSVKIGSQSYPVSEVTENEGLRSKMTKEEQDEYQRICGELYADQYDF